MLPIRQRALDRRSFLRGAGAAVALPWLDAMAPALASPPPPPRRCLFVFAPNGQHMQNWRCSGEGRDFRFGPTLEPLQPHRGLVTVLTGLALDGGRAHGDGPGDHARAAASFLTCAHPRKTGGADLQAGVSIDQVIAAAVGAQTRFPSLELGMEKGAAAGICDSGYACAYSNNISWRTPQTPVAKETDPRALFTRLFGDPGELRDAAARARQQLLDRSVLDAVLGDAKALRGRLGAGDRSKLDDYLQAVRELEQRLQPSATPGAPADGTALPNGLTASNLSFADKLDLCYELLALAFAADQTRIATFMLGNAGSNRSYKFLDVPDGHHDLSHHGKKPEKLLGIAAINRFHLERFAAFIARLQRQRDGDSDLLRQSMIVYASGIGDGDRHNHDDLPVVLCGGGGGAVAKAGRHAVFDRDTPMANLYLAIARAMGLPIESFADSAGVLAL